MLRTKLAQTDRFFTPKDKSIINFSILFLFLLYLYFIFAESMSLGMIHSAIASMMNRREEGYNYSTENEMGKAIFKNKTAKIVATVVILMIYVATRLFLFSKISNEYMGVEQILAVITLIFLLILVWRRYRPIYILGFLAMMVFTVAVWIMFVLYFRSII